MTNQYNFYGVNIDTPLSQAHGSDPATWAASTIGKLSNTTNNQIYIREIPSGSRSAEYGWRVVDAYFSQEDSTVTYFRAYGLDGEFLAQAAFGVNWSSVPARIGGGFKYPPEFGNNYYIPVQNDFATPNTGGYTAQVLDLDYPSEGMAFGMYKQGDQHQCLVISFRLMKLESGYPQT